MTTEEFNTLLNSLINGLPASLVVTRLALALRDVIEDGGADAEESFREFVEAAKIADSDDDMEVPF